MFVVVRDAERRRGLGAIYRKASDIASAMYQARGRPAHLSEEQYRSLMMPIGYPRGKFGPLARRPVAEVAYADRWGATWPG